MLIHRLLPAMLVLLLLGALAAYWVALRAATKAYGRGLLDTAFTIAEQLRVVDGKLHLPLLVQINRQPFGKPNAGEDMTFNFAQLVAHGTHLRRQQHQQAELFDLLLFARVLEPCLP